MAEHSLIVIAVVGATAIVLFALERVSPLRRPKAKLGSRLFVNGMMSLLTYAAAYVFVRPVATAALTWTAETHIGLLHLLGGPVWVNAAVGFLLLDVTFYYWHRLNHRIPILWRFHNVHHADPDLDISTGFRFHFVEVAYSALFRGLQVVLIGASLPLFAAYELVFQLGTFFHHTNVRLPHRLESLLNIVFVTPRMHGIHHSRFHEETDSNYSVVFSFWDRLHRTFRWGIPQDKINIGVPGYAEPRDNSVGHLVFMPFQKQRDYWQGMERRIGSAAIENTVDQK